MNSDIYLKCWTHYTRSTTSWEKRSFSKETWGVPWLTHVQAGVTVLIMVNHYFLNLITRLMDVNIQCADAVRSRAKAFLWPVERDLRQYWCQKDRDIPPIMRKRVTTLPARRRSYPASEKNIILSAWTRPLNVQLPTSVTKQLVSLCPAACLRNVVKGAPRRRNRWKGGWESKE
jgi:hypothetical protein